MFPLFDDMKSKNGFSRATRSITRYMLRQRGWLGVCLSHAGIVSKRLKKIFKLYRLSGSHIILVSSDPCADIQFQGEPLQLGP